MLFTVDDGLARCFQAALDESGGRVPRMDDAVRQRRFCASLSKTARVVTKEIAHLGTDELALLVAVVRGPAGQLASVAGAMVAAARQDDDDGRGSWRAVGADLEVTARVLDALDDEPREPAARRVMLYRPGGRLHERDASRRHARFIRAVRNQPGSDLEFWWHPADGCWWVRAGTPLAMAGARFRAGSTPDDGVEAVDHAVFRAVGHFEELPPDREGAALAAVALADAHRRGWLPGAAPWA